MKLKKILYILLIILLLPTIGSAKEEYPYLPTPLKDKVVSVFDIDISDKTQLYERVNIYENFDVWMIGWFRDDYKIVTGITDLGDIIYYSIASFGDSSPLTGTEVSADRGEEIAHDFLKKIMPEAELSLIRRNAYEYTFTQSHNGIALMGREATVVVDKGSGKVSFYKGFGLVDYDFEPLESLVSPEYASKLFYENIGFEAVYNTVFDHSSRIKSVRPAYILNRTKYKAIDAQSGEPVDIKMYDYNYYYADNYYDERFRFDNNIQTEEKVFTPGEVVYNADISSVMNSPFLSVSSGYTTRLVKGKLNYYSNANGSENSAEVIQINLVPAKYSRQREQFALMFDENNVDFFASLICDTALLFARAYVDAETGRLLDYETIKNPDFSPNLSPGFNRPRVDRFVTGAATGYTLKYYGSQQLSNYEHMLCYARYVDGMRVIGEGACVIYNSFLRDVTDYSLVVTDSEFLPASIMKTPGEMKEIFMEETTLKLYYTDKDENTKFVVYDVTEPYIAFDPITGERTDRFYSGNSSFMCTCSVGSENYIFNGAPYFAAPPIVNSDKLFIPINALAPTLGYNVSYSEIGIILTNGASVVTLSKNSNICTADDRQISLDVPPLTLWDNTYISAQSIRAIFGLFINWNAADNTIYIIR